LARVFTANHPDWLRGWFSAATLARALASIHSSLI